MVKMLDPLGGGVESADSGGAAAAAIPYIAAVVVVAALAAVAAMVISRRRGSPPPMPDGGGGAPPRFSPAQVRTGAVIGAIALGLAVYGFFGSYESIAAMARKHGLPLADWVPIGIDGGLLGTIMLDLFSVWVGMPIRWLKHAARGFTGGTVVANALAGRREVVVATGEVVVEWDWIAIALHVAAPCTFLAMVEAARALLERRLREIKQERGLQVGYEPLGWVCWLVRPVPTFKVWKRMRLSRLHTYREAEDFEADRRAAIALMRMRYGRGFLFGGWRRKYPDIAYTLRTVTRVEVLEEVYGRVVTMTRYAGIPGVAKRSESGAKAGTAPVQAPVQKSRKGSGTAPVQGPVQGSVQGSGNGSGTAPVQAPVQGLGNGSGTAPVHPSEEGPGTAPVQGPVQGSGNGSGTPRALPAGTPRRGRSGTPRALPAGTASEAGPVQEPADPEEAFAWRMGKLREAFPGEPPGAQKIRQWFRSEHDIRMGSEAANRLAAALKAERGMVVAHR